VGSLAVTLAGVALAVPEPGEVPKNWELRFEYLDPQRIAVQLPGEDVPRTYWYVVYTVTNESGQAIQFLPSFELMTDTMKVYPSEIGVHPAVYEAIKKRHRKTHPFMTEPVRMIGRLLHGEDNARDSVAVWADFDPHASRFTVFGGGLSGETRQVRNPLHNASKPEVAMEEMPDGSTLETVVNPKHFTLRKTLVIRYEFPGAESTRDRSKPRGRPHTWIMR